MPKRSIYDTRFFVEYFYSSDHNLLEKLKEDIRSTKERIVSVINPKCSLGAIGSFIVWVIFLFRLSPQNLYRRNKFLLFHFVS